jgi:hypothetical protein
VYAEHLPTEFERDRHYLYDSSGTDIEPIAASYDPVDCSGSWEEWGACSASCGDGTKERSFTVAVQDLYGGAACPASPEAADCNEGACTVTTYFWEASTFAQCSGVRP